MEEDKIIRFGGDAPKELILELRKIAKKETSDGFVHSLILKILKEHYNYNDK